MQKIAVVLTALCAVAVAGCESMGTAAQSKTNQGAVLGSLLGAGTGAIIGNQSGHAGAGTAIGAGLGALGGGLMGHALEEQDRQIQRQQFPPATSTSPATTGAYPEAAQKKFCPVGGEEYPNRQYTDSNMKYCPIHGVELRLKESNPAQ